ncbi:hypothetical protein [Ammoniphilus sp. YIM 78166]|uniref:hypothetical protein n=1 Tax=Ammoniphilus sp. YIM 78166 TaxID=1644106 RepID=UPI00106F583A|nr:hypothetical protein [Ammoniphilus sp. YIM 78166]
MMWAVFGSMCLDLVIGFGRSFWAGTFSQIPTMILGYLKDILYFVAPLTVIMTMMTIDPTGWVLLILYYLGSLAVIWNYLVAIKNKF